MWTVSGKSGKRLEGESTEEESDADITRPKSEGRPIIVAHAVRHHDSVGQVWSTIKSSSITLLIILFIFCRFSLSKQSNTSSCSSKFSFESNQIKSKTFLFYERDWEWEWWQLGNSKPTQKVVIVDQISLSDCGLNDGEKDTSDNHFNYFSYFLPSYSIL